jgi:dihydroorotate dehydrogenase (fumarate)
MADLAGVPLEHPLMNAAGTCKSVDHVARMARSAVAAVVVGSITAEPRTGNAGDVYWTGPGWSLNSLGLPNRGADDLRQQLPRMVELTRAAGKPLVVSVAGFDVDEYARLADAASGADLVEVNLGCPNVWDGGEQKRIACFDPDQTERVCRAVNEALAPAGTPFGVKVSPFSDPVALATLGDRLARLAADLDTLRFVTAVNTFPNGFQLDGAGRPVIDVGYAGVSGAALKPIGLGQVRQLRALLPPTVDVVGAGGVGHGRDVHDYLTVGAAAVQAATAFWNAGEDPRAFGEILSGYVDQLGEGA